MFKLFKFVTILVITFVLFTPAFVKATNVNMNLNSNGNTYSDNTSNRSQSSTTNTLPSNESNSSNNSTTVSSLRELPEADLGLTNILLII